LSVYADRLDILKGAVEGGSRRIYFEPLMEKGRKDRDRIETILARLQEAKELCSKAELIWKWPRITRDDFIDLALPLLSEVQVNGIMVENVGPAWAIKEKMPEMPIYGGSGLNVWNHLTAQALAPQFSWLTLSPELSSHQLKDAASALRALPGRDGNPKLELVVQGSLEVMVAEDSVPQLAKGRSSEEFWGLQDFKHIFPLKVDDEGRTHIFNSAETCLIDLMSNIFRIGLDSIAVDARGRTEKYAREMTEAYLRAVDVTAAGLPKGDGPLKEDLQELKERIRPLALGAITYGHFIKGLKDEIAKP
jgi:putative protease